MRSLSGVMLRCAGLGCGLLLAGCQPERSAEPPPSGRSVETSTESSVEKVEPVEKPAVLQIHEEPCGESPDGQKISQFVLSNRHGMRVKIINWGGILTSVEVPDRLGKNANVTLGFKSLENYFENAPYFGGICGRFANRIAGAKFTLDGQEYRLFANIPPNTLHGGKESFIKKSWRARMIEQPTIVGVELTYISPDGEDSSSSGGRAPRR